jgi:fluoroquinolone transport system permease protein
MKQTMKLFQMGLKQITNDGMLLVLLPAPILIGLFFKFAIPFANGILEDSFSFSLLPWYGLVDGVLVCLTPMFVAMVSAFLLLEERDEGISAFYQITPTEGYSYLVARIGIPTAWAFAMSIIAIGVFRISELSVMTILSSSLISALTGIFLAMMVVSIAGNRVEGLALSKLMGISFLGLILVWFIPAPYSYFSAFLPSFWIGKLIMDGANIFSFIFGLLTCLIWIFFFTKRFLSRIC